MKKILVPIDFSDGSISALKTSLFLGEKLNAKIDLFHCIPESYNTTFPIPSIAQKEDVKAFKEDLKTFFKKNTSEHEYKDWMDNHKIQFLISAGIVSDEILRAAENNYHLVVLGKTGSGNVLSNLLGSVSTSVVKNCPCSVLLVPKTISTSFVNMVYAFDEDSLYTKNLHWILHFAEALQAQIHFIHISQEESDEEEMVNKISKKIIDKENVTVAFQIKIFRSGDVIEGLNEYCKVNDIDLLSMVHLKRSFFDQLIHHSTTLEAISGIKELPFLVLEKEK